MADLHSAVRPIGIGGLTALTDTVIVRIPTPPFGRWRSVTLLLLRLSGVIASWTQRSSCSGRLMSAGKMPVSHLAHVLCEMAVRHAGPSREPLAEYSFPVVQEHLADATAMTSVHVNRSLKALRDDRLATVRQGLVQIHDWVGLMNVGEFDPTYLNADTQPDRQRRLIFN